MKPSLAIIAAAAAIGCFTPVVFSQSHYNPHIRQHYNPGPSSTPEVTTSCPDMCPALYDPVCGSDGKSYSNNCKLMAAQCKHPELKLTKVKDGECSSTSSTSPTKRPTESPTEVPTEAPTTAPTGAPTKAPTKAPTPAPTTDCPDQICPAVYEPVCGSDGKTYPNECGLDMAQCRQPQLKLTKVHDGECGSPAQHTSSPTPAVTTSCPDMCPALYDPVCGSDGKSYSNNCKLMAAQCKHPELKLTKVKDGKCGGRLRRAWSQW